MLGYYITLEYNKIPELITFVHCTIKEGCHNKVRFLENNYLQLTHSYGIQLLDKIFLLSSYVAH